MQTHTHELTLALDRLGVVQTVVTTRPPTVDREQTIGVRSRVIRLGLPVPWFRQLYSWPAAGLLPRLAADADLIHAHLGEDLAVVPLALRAARRHNLPLVLTVHTSVRHTLAVTGPRSALLATVGGALERRGAAAAAAVIALAPRLAELIRADGRTGPVYVVPSGVTSARPDSDGDEDLLAGIPRPRVVFLGRLHAQKQVDTLVRAAGQLPDTQIVLVGDGPERASLQRLAQRLGVAARVRFLGFVPHERVAGLLRGADALALPSRYEELGTALLEGMQAGLPIVASATGGVRQVIDDGRTGLLVPPGDPSVLAAALRQVLTDSTLAARLGGAARIEATRYDWTDLADQILVIYNSVLHTGGRQLRAEAVT
ncbi:MAG: glycosyltransferase [Sporichthyaceae bacterium]|nr:glycosyltransferase [Sporichthyaceae bacterium]